MRGAMPNRHRTVITSNSSLVCSAAFAAVATMLPASAQAVTRTENFDLAPAHWTALNNNVDGSVYGFSSGNLTGQTSPGGEAGGTFARSTTHGYYADATIGGLTQEDFIHGEGEFWFGNGAAANT